MRSSGVDGSGTANYISKWTDGDTIGNSNITDDGTSIRFTTHTDGTYIPVAVPNTINTGWNNSGDSHALWINYYGYLGSTTKFRDLKIGDGKAAAIATFDGSSGFVGINDAAPPRRLSITGEDGAYSGQVSGNSRTHLLLENNAANLIEFLNPSTSAAGIYWSNNTGQNRAGITLDTSDRLQFQTGGTANRMVIKSDGNVGIGTASPAQKLHVEGNIRLSINSFLYWGATGTRIVGNADYMRFNTGSVDALSIDSSQRVGIGTTAPGKLLTLSSANAQLMLNESDQSSGSQNWLFNAEGGTLYFQTLGGTAGSVSSGSTWMQVVRSGTAISSVSISSATTLDGTVSVGGTANGLLYIKEDNGSNTIQLRADVSNSYNEIDSQKEFNIRTEAGALRFSTANTERMRILG